MPVLVRLDDETLGWDGHAVLSHLSLGIAAGERVVLLGKSGAGKSTLLAALRTRLPGRVALVPQDHGLVGPLSVFHNVWMGRLDDHGTARNLRTLVWPRPQERREVEAALNIVGLDGLGRRAVDSLSGGQRQRVALARAFLRGGAVVLGDEPVSAVDPAQGAELLAALGQSFGTAVLALHDVGQALSFASRIIGLRDGRIAFDLPADEVDADAAMALYA